MIGNPLYLKKNKSALCQSRHPWIFNGAVDVQKSGNPSAGLATLLTADGRFAAIGTYNPKSAIAFRMLSKREQEIDGAFFETRFRQADALRRAALPAETDGYRLINSEGDGLPGLTVDGFAGHLAVQVGTPVMAELTSIWLPALLEVYAPLSVFRKDSQSVANREHMTAVTEGVHGDVPETVSFEEGGVRFRAAIQGGQKTGFFFDQRDHRIRIGALAKGRRILDGYAYTGGFGAHALAAGAEFVTGVESSSPACELMAENYELGGPKDRFEVVSADCARFLKETEQFYDVVILDPPALAKRRQHLKKASRVYQDIFAGGMRRVSPGGGWLLACSCSAQVDRGTLLSILARSAEAASRSVRVLHTGGAGPDHPVSVYHPEGHYLNSVLAYVI